MITKELANVGPITNRLSAKGKDLGSRIAYSGNQTASEIRASLRESGFKGKELTYKVNEILSGEADVRWVKHEQIVSIARSNGFVPDYTDASAKGTSMTTRYVRPEQQFIAASSVAEKNAVIAALQAELAELKALVAPQS